MFDARYLAFATISALLVISPGATMAVVMETVLGEGRVAGLLTVLGINIGNATLALASALGMSVVFHAWPSSLEAVKIAGAVYLAYLGLRGIWLAWYAPAERAAEHPPAERAAWHAPANRAAPLASSEVEGARRPEIRQGRARSFAGPDEARRVTTYLSRGIMTNLLNPPVVLFYMTFLPQFIGPQDAFFGRFLVLAGTHVGMSLAWLASYAFALGALADRFARPAVRRTLEGLTGALLLAFAVRMLLR